MKQLYRSIMALSVDYIGVYKYILSRSMAEKDYDTSLNQLNTILKGIKQTRLLLEKEKNAYDYKLFIEHLINIEFVALDMIPIVIGLKARAERTGKYGFFQYRKDLKTLNNSYDNFEYTGNQMNLLN